jgi:menaquinone-dependent protoporphyrinogen oxidase
MAGVLLVYATTHGHTSKIAQQIAAALSAASLDVDLRALDGAGDPEPGRYVGVIVGASLHGGHHQRESVAWARRHRAELEARPSAFFSVSLTAAEDSHDAREAIRRCIDESSARPAGRRVVPSPWRVRCSTASTTSSHASSCG